MDVISIHIINIQEMIHMIYYFFFHRNNMNDNMSAMMDGVGKMSSVDTIYVTNMTHSTNGELSTLKDSILVFNNDMIPEYVLHHKSMESRHIQIVSDN